MKERSQFARFNSLLLSLFLTSLLAGVALAQSPTPLDILSIALWPEYDEPEVLIIYRGQVADGVTLPAQVSFNLPATVDDLHAVAYFDEGRGNLVNVPDFDLVEGDEDKVLSFTTPGPQFQFEYYSGDPLTINDGGGGGVRDLAFSFIPNAEVGNLSLELQQPIGAQGFTSDPPPSETQVRQDGLTYALYNLGAVSPGETLSLQASYTRSSDQLSADALAGVSLPPPAEQTPVKVGGGGLKDNLGPILIGVGILLLTGSLVYWFWSQRSVVVPEPAARQPTARARRPARKEQPDAARSAPPPAKEAKLAAYCHRCGTKFREDAQFCHACGSERRAE